MQKHSRKRESDLSRWRVSRTTAGLIFAVPLIGLAAVIALRHFDQSLLLQITGEDSWLEWCQFAAFAVATVAAGSVALRLMRRGQRYLGVLYAGLAVATFFVAGEEIAWGQRLFGLHTPESIALGNTSQELAVHNSNLDYVPPFNRLQVIAGVYGSLVAWVVHWFARGRGRSAVDLLVPPLFVTSAFACVMGLGLVRAADEIDPTGMTYGEWAEFCMGFGIAVFAVLVSRLLRPEPAALPADSPHAIPVAFPERSSSRSRKASPG